MIITKIIIIGYTYSGFASSYCSRTDRASFLIPAEDFGHTTVGNAKLSGDHAGTDAVVSHFNYFVADMIWQRPAIDENSTKLIDSTLTQRGWNCSEEMGIKSNFG